MLQTVLSHFLLCGQINSKIMKVPRFHVEIINFTKYLKYVSTAKVFHQVSIHVPVLGI